MTNVTVKVLENIAPEFICLTNGKLFLIEPGETVGSAKISVAITSDKKTFDEAKEEVLKTAKQAGYFIETFPNGELRATKAPPAPPAVEFNDFDETAYSKIPPFGLLGPVLFARRQQLTATGGSASGGTSSAQGGSSTGTATNVCSGPTPPAPSRHNTSGCLL